MNFKKLVLSSFGLISAVALIACGDSDSTSASNSEDVESSSSVASFKSSSSLSDRADIDYKGSVSIGDTMRLYIELFQGDSSKMDSSVLYVDSNATNFPMYLGELPVGSRIKIQASTYNIEGDTIRIRNEFGDYLKALTAVPKAGRKDSAFVNYFVPSNGKENEGIFKDSNQFVVFKDQHYYLEIGGEFTDSSSIRMQVLVDTAYYGYTGSEEQLKMKMSDSLRGIVLIDDAPGKVSIQFAATEGYSINLTTRGTNVVQYELIDGETVIGSSNKNIDTLLVPNDSVIWNLDIKTENSSSIWTGPFAFFEAKTVARQLEQGEYFTNPDSIRYPGETFLRTRPKNTEAKYELRQEQYIWIGDYQKGDSVMVTHWIKNYDDDNFTSPVTIEILDKNKKVQGSVSSTYGGGFSVSGDMPEGPYYLHYTRFNSKPLEQVDDSLRYVLQLYTLVQQPGLLKSMNFYNAEKDTIDNNIRVAVGDTLRFSNFQFNMNTKDGKSWDDVGLEISWFVPCASLEYINNNYSIASCESDGKEQEISSNYLIAQPLAAGNTASLIAQSTADPTKRVTLNVKIVAK